MLNVVMLSIVTLSVVSPFTAQTNFFNINKWSNLLKRVSKFTPKKFYEVDPCSGISWLVYKILMGIAYLERE